MIAAHRTRAVIFGEGDDTALGGIVVSTVSSGSEDQASEEWVCE